jgi:hypothetical protein
MLPSGATQHHVARCVPAGDLRAILLAMQPDAEQPDLAATNDPVEPDPAGIGPGGGTPYTVYFPSEHGYLAADLGHAAPLPHVGDFVEYIDEGRVTHRYRVREVVHTLQLAPSYRPRPRAAGAAAEEGEPEKGEPGEEASDGPHRIPEGAELRAGLPEVILEELSGPR